MCKNHQIQKLISCEKISYIIKYKCQIVQFLLQYHTAGRSHCNRVVSTISTGGLGSIDQLSRHLFLVGGWGVILCTPVPKVLGRTKLCVASPHPQHVAGTKGDHLYPLCCTPWYPAYSSPNIFSVHSLLEPIINELFALPKCLAQQYPNKERFLQTCMVPVVAPAISCLDRMPTVHVKGYSCV